MYYPLLVVVVVVVYSYECCYLLCDWIISSVIDFHYSNIEYIYIGTYIYNINNAKKCQLSNSTAHHQNALSTAHRRGTTAVACCCSFCASGPSRREATRRMMRRPAFISPRVHLILFKWKGSWGSWPSAIHTVGHPLGPGKELPRQDGSRRG